MDTLYDKIRTAKKQHRCDWCGNIIKKGEKYRHSVNVDGGDMWSFREHLVCNRIFEVFAKRLHRHYCECYTSEFFEEYACEELKAHVCKDCPQFVHPPVGTSVRGRCRHPDGWTHCIDKLYESLLKRGEIKEDEK